MEFPGKIQAVQYIEGFAKGTSAKDPERGRTAMVCANCGRELEERGCKVRCRSCGYFEDCSDPSAPGEWEREGRTGSPAPAPEEPERSETRDETG